MSWLRSSTRPSPRAATWSSLASAVGRTQELLYFIREIKDKGLVKSMPNFPVYVDSPLAKKRPPPSSAATCTAI